VEQSGLIRVLRGGTLDAEPLLDLSSEIALVDANDERGLLGLALAPDFATSRRFYVMLTPTRGDDRNRDVVREYTVGSATPSRTLLALPASAPNHNGGTLLFAPDGTLYVGTGDGGGGCNDNQRDTPQDPRSQFGKILRLDPAKTAAPYAADGNPYPEAPAVLHVGLRNPFRFNIDPESKLLIIGDVGQNSYEELDLVSLDAPGKNFGWAAFEGLTATCSGRELGAQTAWERPVFVADRRGNGQCTGDTRFCDWRSVLGGQVYRGAAIPELVGTLIFGDYRGVRLAAVTHCDGVTSDYTAIARACDPNAPDEACFAADDDTSIAALTAIVRDHDGELVLVANGNQLLQVVPGSL
jgi:glucose/arabinose dehydrogenase